MASFIRSFQKVALIAAIPVAFGSFSLVTPALAQGGGQQVAATDVNAAAAVAIVNAAGKAKKDGGSVSGAIADLLVADVKAPGLDLKQIMSVVRGDATISPADIDRAIADAKSKLASDKAASDALDAASKVQALDKKADCSPGDQGCTLPGTAVQTSATDAGGAAGAAAGVQTGATGAAAAAGGGAAATGALPGGNSPTSYQASIVSNSASTSYSSASRASVSKSSY